MNAAKKIRKLIESGREPNQLEVLKQLAIALETKKKFDISQLYEIDLRYFELGIELMKDWRLDRHLTARNRLSEEITGRPNLQNKSSKPRTKSTKTEKPKTTKKATQEK